MSPSRSVSLSAAAAAAGACLLLTACSGGSITPSSASGSSSSGSSSSSPSSGAASSAAAGSASASATPAPVSTAPAPVTTAHLTGDFCTDFMQLGTTFGKLPQPNDSQSLSQEEAIARADGGQIEGAFDGLAGEAPPNVAGALHTIVSLYQTELAAMGTFSSMSQLKQSEVKITSEPGYTSAFSTLIQYTVTKCK